MTGQVQLWMSERQTWYFMKGVSTMRQALAKSSPLYAGLYGEMIAEFFGTMILVLFGDGCVATFLLFNNISPFPFANIWTVVIFGWGLAVMLGIYVAGAVSGAHINPAVTLGFAVNGR